MALVTIGVTLPGSWLRWVARTQGMDFGSSGFGSRRGRIGTWTGSALCSSNMADPRTPLGCLPPFRESQPRIFMDYVDFLISACMRHLPYFILRESVWSSRNYPPMFIGQQTDVKPPFTPQKIKTVIKSTNRFSQCRLKATLQTLFTIPNPVTARQRSRRQQGRVRYWAAKIKVPRACRAGNAS